MIYEPRGYGVANALKITAYQECTLFLIYGIVPESRNCNRPKKNVTAIKNKAKRAVEPHHPAPVCHGACGAMVERPNGACSGGTQT
jgi:hypothetical protein